MRTYLALAIITLLYFALDLAPRRLRLPLSAIFAIGLGGALLVTDWNEPPLGLLGFAGVITMLFGLALSALTLLVQTPAADEPTADTTDALFVPARLITGRWALTCIEGFLVLYGARLRFVTVTGQMKFDLDLQRTEVSSLPLERQGDLRIESDAGNYSVSLGHFFVGFGELIDKRDFWSEAINSRTRRARRAA